MELAVVIVAYKTKELLRTCLASVFQECGRFLKGFDVIVVDNASGDGTVEMVREEFPKVLLIENEGNLGPAGAFNRGLEIALKRAPAVILANSDIKVLDRTIQGMFNYLNDNPHVDGVCGPLLNPDLSRQMMRTGIMSLRRRDFTKRFRATFVGTTFAMIRTATFRKVGGYDESYYFYNEDLDWAERAKRLGCKFTYLPDAPVIHYLSQGSKQNKSRIIKELYKSNTYFMKKFYGPLALLGIWSMRVEIGRIIGGLQADLAKATDPEEREAILQRIQDYQEARVRMDAEYREKRRPAAPDFRDKQ